jgi:hypothetical protein
MDNKRKALNEMMKYTVSMENRKIGGEYKPAEYIVVNVTQKQAVALASKTAEENPDKQVFVSWFRASDGQNGYLNSNGDHAVVGKAW